MWPQKWDAVWLWFWLNCTVKCGTKTDPKPHCTANTPRCKHSMINHTLFSLYYLIKDKNKTKQNKTKQKKKKIVVVWSEGKLPFVKSDNYYRPFTTGRYFYIFLIKKKKKQIQVRTSCTIATIGPNLTQKKKKSHKSFNHFWVTKWVRVVCMVYHWRETIMFG